MIENRSDKKLRILETSDEAERSPKSLPGRTEPDKVLSRPDPEVPSKATRRRFSARHKLRILEQADGCEESGGVGALLRREGLYWSNLQTCAANASTLPRPCASGDARQSRSILWIVN